MTTGGKPNGDVIDSTEANTAAEIDGLKERVMHLEEKLSYAERSVGELNDIVTEQAEKLDEALESLDTMRSLVLQFRDQMGAGEVEGSMPENDPVPNSG